MSKHAPKKYSSSATVTNPQGNREKTQLFFLSCTPCGVYARPFTTRAARDRAAQAHK